MLEVTPQERLALTVLSILLVGGAIARHMVNRADAREWLEYSAEVADTLSPTSNSALRDRVEHELTLDSIREAPLRPGEPIDPNRATAEQLDRLPRVGPALAERIIDHRDENGRFRSLDDLDAVSGIGPSLLEGIAPFVDLEAASARGTRESRSGNQIDINRATAKELEALPGVGPSIAERIVEHRTRNGRFSTFEDLEQVSGIGPSLRERIEEVARLGS